MKARKKFFTMFLSMLLVFTMMPLSAIPVTAADSTDPPPAALDQTKPVDETLTETDIQTETESKTTPEPPPASETPEPDPGITATGRMTVSQPTMTAAAGDACIQVIMDNGQKLNLYPGNTIKKNHSGDYYTEAVTNRPSSYVARLKKTAQYQWTLELNGFNGQSITYVPGDKHANSVVISLNGNNVLAPKDGGAVDENQHIYRAISCGKETDNGGIPLGLSFTINGSGSLAINANDRNTAWQMLTAQCIFTKGLTIKEDAKVSIDLKLPSYESDGSHAIFTSDLYVSDSASLDIKSYNVGEVVRASAHDKGGKSFISINTTGTVNVEFGCDDLERTNPRVFCGYPNSEICVYSIDKVGYMSIARKGSCTDNYNEPEDFKFIADPKITVSGDVTEKTFTSDNIKRIQYFPELAAAVRVQLFDGRIQDGKFKAYDELWGPLKDKSVDITITAPESAAPFDRWSTITDDLTAEDPGADLPVNGQPVSDETVTLHITGAGSYYILAKYDPFGGTPTWTKGYSPVANCTTGTVSWTAPDSLKGIKGMLVPATFQLSGSSPVAAKDTSGNDIKAVVSGRSVFAKQSGSGITYALPDTGAKRIALNFDGRWHFSEPFVPDLDDLTLPPAPQLVSLNCSGGQTPLSPRETACYPFARGLIVKATNFDYDKYEMYYTFNKSGSGGNDPGEPTGTSPRANNGVIVLKDSETWLGVTNLRVRFKSKATGAWSPTTKILLQKISESQNQLYEVTFAPEGNYTLKGSTVTITDSITATVTKVKPDEWPINAELVYSTQPKTAAARFFELYTGAVSIDDAGAFRVGVRVPDPQSSSDEYSVIRKENFTIKLDPTITRYDLTVVNGRAYRPDGSEYSTTSTGSARTYSISGNELVEIRANKPASGKAFEKWDLENVSVADPYNPTTTLTMPTHDNARVTANINGNPLITGETRLKMTPGDGPIGALRFFNNTFGSRRMLTYDWYEGSRKLGPDDDFEPGKCYTAQVEVKPVEGAYFDSRDNLSMRLNHALGTEDILFTRVSDQLLRAQIRLLFKPVLTMALHPGDTLPTVAELNDQLPVGYTVTTLTWADNAAAVPGGATEMTITELKISGTESRGQITGGAVVIDGTAYPVSKSYFNTLTLTNVKVPVKAKGVEVSGTVTSYGSDSENVTVQLIETDLTEPAYEATVTGNSTTYSFETVPAGTYTLKMMKKGHAPWTESITVGTDSITGKNVTVYLWGDVNRDGVVTAADAQEIQRNAAGLSSVFDTDPNSAYCTLRADVNRDGAITAADAQEIQRKAAGLSSIILTLP